MDASSMPYKSSIGKLIQRQASLCQKRPWNIQRVVAGEKPRHLLNRIDTSYRIVQFAWIRARVVDVHSSRIEEISGAEVSRLLLEYTDVTGRVARGVYDFEVPSPQFDHIVVMQNLVRAAHKRAIGVRVEIAWQRPREWIL